MITELCGVIQHLIVQIEELKRPKVVVTADPDNKVELPEPVSKPQPWESPTKRDVQPLRTPPLVDPKRKTRTFNAGDAE